jgi:ribonuclease HIII
MECDFALSDKFEDEILISDALLKKGKEINLLQRTKAEELLAIAAVSIVWLSRMSEKYGKV